jgi:DNA (cytosine-5)-methyltransferase 1
MPTKVLNLYAGIGGNRKLWEDVDVTAVEKDPEIARVYRDHFPNDTVIETDAHEYLKENFDDYEFIWASPPCPTHSRLRQLINPNTEPVYPDMRLYQEILFLQYNFDGDYVVENVEPFYQAMYDPMKRGRHMFWSNFYIPEIELPAENVKRQDCDWRELANRYGFDVEGYGFSKKEKEDVLNNCVHPELGKHIIQSATKFRQDTLV